MRRPHAFYALLAGVLLAACSSTPKDPATPAGAAGNRPALGVTPLPHPSGRVVAVNPALRFVVVDFFPAQLPAIEQTMFVYRQGQKVGEIRISGPARQSAIAADIMEGEASVGDEVLWE